MKKRELLDNMSREYEALQSLLASLDEATLETPGVYDELSVKDVVAHLAAWAQMEAEWLRTALRGEEVVQFAPGFILEPGHKEEVMHRLNAHILEESRRLRLPAVLESLAEAHHALLETIASMPEEDLNDPERFEWWSGEPVWTSIAGNSYEHFAEHRALIEAWLSRGKR